MTKISVQVDFVPAQGEKKAQTIEVENGKSVEDALKAAGYTSASGNVVVNDEPVAAKVKVKAGDRITITERAVGS